MILMYISSNKHWCHEYYGFCCLLYLCTYSLGFQQQKKFNGQKKHMYSNVLVSFKIPDTVVEKFMWLSALFVSHLPAFGVHWVCGGIWLTYIISLKIHAIYHFFICFLNIWFSEVYDLRLSSCLLFFFFLFTGIMLKVFLFLFESVLESNFIFVLEVKFSLSLKYEMFLYNI